MKRSPTVALTLHDAHALAAPNKQPIDKRMRSIITPETREAAIHHVQQRETKQEPTRERELAASLLHTLSFFAALLLLDFIVAFGMAFIEPQIIFYCPLRRAPFPLASQGGYNEAVEQDAIERLAA